MRQTYVKFRHLYNSRGLEKIPIKWKKFFSIYTLKMKLLQYIIGGCVAKDRVKNSF